MIKGTWEKDRLNGLGTIKHAGKSEVEVIFKEDIIIQKHGQMTDGDKRYFIFTAIQLITFGVTLYLLINRPRKWQKKDIGWALFATVFICYCAY